MTYHLAIDIGASGGRHILGALQDGKLVLEEIYRFENGMKKEGTHLTWDIAHLLNEVKAGIIACKAAGKIPATLAIDTWGVDYVLLDETEREILPVYAYRDVRCQRAAEAVAEILPQSALYAKTGIQKQSFNTLYQLYDDRITGRLEKARHFLMIPDYLVYKLTGVMKNEYTNATTTNLVGGESKTWEAELLSALGISTELFLPPSLPGTEVGSLTPAVRAEVGFDCRVLLCPSHDTASAVAACPMGERGMYLSSGTWSLIGIENARPILNDTARDANFTNEGGIDYRFRFLKNIMGMWLFQSIRKDLDKKYTYDEMMRLAMASAYTKTFDPNDPRLAEPENMIEAVRACLGEGELPLGDVLSAVYHSLAHSYRRAAEEVERISGKTVEQIVIVGGGSKDVYLNRLTAGITGKRVLTGFTEATATGNLLSQIMAFENIDLIEARALVKRSFEIKEIRS
ncbi:MAG: rhamnulokinase [Clostridia bacterium]|nr:rhamnulokinase [Clostridia bacterium]